MGSRSPVAWRGLPGSAGRAGVRMARGHVAGQGKEGGRIAVCKDQPWVGTVEMQGVRP